MQLVLYLGDGRLFHGNATTPDKVFTIDQIARPSTSSVPRAIGAGLSRQYSFECARKHFGCFPVRCIVAHPYRAQKMGFINSSQAESHRREKTDLLSPASKREPDLK
jgi:hypothetical protein